MSPASYFNAFEINPLNPNSDENEFLFTSSLLAQTLK